MSLGGWVALWVIWSPGFDVISPFHLFLNGPEWVQQCNRSVRPKPGAYITHNATHWRPFIRLQAGSFGCEQHIHTHASLSWLASAAIHLGCGSSALWTDTREWSELYKAPSTKCCKLMSHLHIHTCTDIFRKQIRTKNNVCNVLWS